MAWLKAIGFHMSQTVSKFFILIISTKCCHFPMAHMLHDPPSWFVLCAVQIVGQGFERVVI